ncbi:MAG: acetate--CoA ligase family protein, partial [Gammaproteobacteria bacterium]|nr:acetate--CoA ligase family protein [Gammaproteobacteria bacterium]
QVEHGVAIVSQGGGVLCDAVFCDRGLSITHMVGCGNQAVTGAESYVDYLLDNPRVRAVGLSFEGLHDVAGLRRAAARALSLGKPIVALKFGKSEAGARAAASHTASMTGRGEAWEALFRRLGIVSVASESEFFETLKLFDSGHIPKGRRVLVTAASGVMGVMLADHLSAAGFDLPQPDGDRAQKLRELLPGIATPCNPQDVTMAVWNHKERQRDIYATLLEQGYDTALMVQNYPREGMWDVSEYEAQVEALGEACAGCDVAALQLAPMVDCFPDHARDHTLSLGLAAMQGLEECIAALGHALWWRERRDVLRGEGLEALAEVDGQPPLGGVRLDEAAAKALLGSAGVYVPENRVATADGAADAAAEIGFPVAIKALDARLLHKTECGAVRIGLADGAAVLAAVDEMRGDMARHVPDIPLNNLLIERMVDDVIAEMMASVSFDPSVGAVMMIAGGGVEAELWNDSILLAAPFTRAEIGRGLECLKIARRLRGWRGAPGADIEALLGMLQALAEFAMREAVEEIEINPILVGRQGVLAADAVLKIRQRKARVA